MTTKIDPDGIDVPDQDLAALSPDNDDHGRIFYHDGSSAIVLVSGRSTAKKGQYSWDNNNSGWFPVGMGEEPKFQLADMAGKDKNPGHNQGRIYYNETDKALTYHNEASPVEINIGQEVVFRGKNNDGSKINNGEVVFISSAVGALPQLRKAGAGSPLSKQTIGVATMDIPNKKIGYVTTFGTVRDLDTSQWAEGTELFIGTIAGQLVPAEPDFPNRKIRMAVVTRSHGENGKIFVQRVEREKNIYEARSSDPVDPPVGEAIQWLSDGTGSGADGDLMAKITNAAGVTKTITLVDFSTQ